MTFRLVERFRISIDCEALPQQRHPGKTWVWKVKREMSDPYTNAANECTQQIRQHSLAAADCIAEIQRIYGARAAYLASFALMAYRERLTQTRRPPSRAVLKRSAYYKEMSHYPHAIELFEAASAYLIPENNRRQSLV